MINIKCKIDCQVVDCQDCADAHKEIEDMVQADKVEISDTKDATELFYKFQVMMFMQESIGELIELCKSKFHELDVTIPKSESLPQSVGRSDDDYGC